MSLGNKAINLIKLVEKYKLPVPEFITIKFSQAISNYKEINTDLSILINKVFIDKISLNTYETNIKKIIKKINIDESTITQLSRTLRDKKWDKVSYRTSAVNEDGVTASFAGQYESFLNVDYGIASLHKYIMKCFISTFSSRVIVYAKSNSISDFNIGGSVIFHEMFFGDYSGVMFTETGRSNIEFAYTHSWQNTTVEGQNSISKLVSKIDIKNSSAPKQIRQLAELGMQLEIQEGTPLDIEWAYKSNKIQILQMRPLTTINRNYQLNWDNTNIAENYPEITLPLTYSIIRKLYARVYPSFFKMMGVSQKKLESKSTIFDNSLGYLNGHVYYRIDNWYEIIQLIPGRNNQIYFEAMLNPVKNKSLQIKPKKIPDIDSIIGLFRFSWLLLNSERLSRRFKRVFIKKYDFYQNVNLDNLSADVIMMHIKQTRIELLQLWAIPVLNDIRVMVFHGILKTWFFGKDQHESYLSFLEGLTDQASIKPLYALQEMGNNLKTTMKENKIKSFNELRKSSLWPTAIEQAKSYIDDFGGRTPDELQLEKPRLSDDKSNIIQLALNSTYNVPKTSNKKTDGLEHLSFHKRILAHFIAHQTRKAIDWRERFRFNRAQTFGLTRKAYLSIASIMLKTDLIVSKNDIFWLTEEEIEDTICGHAWDYDLKSIIAKRKKLNDKFLKSDLAMRMSSYGLIAPLSTYQDTPQSDDNSLSGNGVAPGIITAEVVVATEFDPSLDVQNKILVVRHIDPGWTILFTQAAGVITEKGNALSHAAIVAREIGIPAIVKVINATKNLKSGDIITINGVSGEIKLKH